MAKKRRKKKKVIEVRPKNKYPILTSKLRKQIIIVIMLALAVIIFLSFFNIAGQGGKFLFSACDFLIGKTTFSIPLLLILGAILFIKPQKKRIFAPVFGALILLLIGISGLFQVLILEGRMGGALGYMTSWPLLKFFGPLVSAIVFSVLILVGLLIIWEFIPKRKPVEKKEEKQEKKEIFIKKMPEFKPKKIEKIEKQEKPKEETVPVVIKGKYISPPLDLLSSLNQKPSTGDTEYAGQIIKKTLSNFGISVEIEEINIGPTVTQYALKPAEGVKLSKIVGLNNDLALALAAHPIRIEAPIPSRSLVGIEVPNKVRAIVALKDVMLQTKFMDQQSPLMIPLGEDVSGNPMLANLDKMPHILGSWKHWHWQDYIFTKSDYEPDI